MRMKTAASAEGRSLFWTVHLSQLHVRRCVNGFMSAISAFQLYRAMAQRRIFRFRLRNFLERQVVGALPALNKDYIFHIGMK